jgi:hypothetical protein
LLLRGEVAMRLFLIAIPVYGLLRIFRVDIDFDDVRNGLLVGGLALLVVGLTLHFLGVLPEWAYE